MRTLPILIGIIKMSRMSGPIRSVSNPNVNTGNSSNTSENNGFICQSGSLGSVTNPPTDALIIVSLFPSLFLTGVPDVNTGDWFFCFVIFIAYSTTGSGLRTVPLAFKA